MVNFSTTLPFRSNSPPQALPILLFRPLQRLGILVELVQILHDAAERAKEPEAVRAGRDLGDVGVAPEADRVELLIAKFGEMESGRV